MANTQIMKRVEKHYQEFKRRYPDLEFFAIALQGSQNYNLDMYTDTYKSDVDTKILVVPSFKDIVKNKEPISTTIKLDNGEQIDLKDIRVMFNNFKKQNINYLEILFTEYECAGPRYADLWTRLRTAREQIAHYDEKRALKCMAGMSMEKKKAMCHEYPSTKPKIDQYGYDGKQLHHIIRMNGFMEQYVKGVPFKECLITHPDLELLTASKLNELSYEEAVRYAEFFNNETLVLEREVTETLEVDKKNQTFVDNLLFDILYQAMKRNFKEEIFREDMRKE